MALDKLRFCRRLATVGLVLGGATILWGCSTIAGLFPDKQKEYRYSTELPPLEIPPDMTTSTMEGGRESSRSGGYPREAADEELPDAQASERAETGAQSALAAETPKASAPVVTLAQGSDDVPLIEVESPFAETWNDVSRALGRLEVEISDQNRSDGVFYVYYGGETKRYEDRGLWQDIASLFSGEGTKAEEFRIKLEAKEDVTHIFVLDTAGTPVTEGNGLELLKRLYEKLQTLDKPEPEPERPGSQDEQ